MSRLHSRSLQDVSQRSRPRTILRDLVVCALVYQPLPVKQWLHRYFRQVILGVLFRLEREAIVLAFAGPPGHRFPMYLDWQGHTAYVLGLYEPQVTQALKRYLRAGARCMDVGAHLGYTTILMAHLVGPRGSLVAFEPFPKTFRLLEENVRLNELTNIRLEPLAASDQDGSVSLVFEANQQLASTPSVSGYAVEQEKGNIEVRCVSLDSYVARTGWTPELVKIDVEGAELAVLRGATHTIRNARPIFIVEVHGWGTPESIEVIRFLQEARYVVSTLGIRDREAFCLALPGP